MKISFEETKTILAFLKAYDETFLSLTQDQAEKVKSIWVLLHYFDDAYEYTFNNDYSVLRKEKRIVWKKKTLQTSMK